ncbi:MAG: DUF1887 family CARF protein [Desulfuromusa sp.]|nr:DUF1887 family CARF protein [Desulfuromusa sp.]
MVRADVHVCLVSDQLLPNLLPALDIATRPDDVVLLVTPKMMSAAARLKLLLRDAGCLVIEREVKAYRIEDIRDAVLDIVASYSGRKLMLNATGGTKVMALGAYGVFRDLGLPVFYIDTENEAVVFLTSPQKTSHLPDLLKVKTGLKCYGYKIVAEENPELQPENLKLYQTLIDEITHWEKVLARLNYFAGAAQKHLWCELDRSTINDHQFIDLITLFQTAGHLTVAGDRLGFSSENSRRLVQGGWLEHYVYGLIENLRRKGRVMDAAIGVVIENRRGTKNELDVVCTYANRLHVIECKTAQLRGEKTKGDDVVYKLDNLRDLMGGTYGRALLVSYRQMRQEDLKRCQDNDVSVVCGHRLQQLETNLPRWLAGELLK